MKIYKLILLTFYLLLGFVFQFPSVSMRFWCIETVKMTPAQMMGMAGVIGIPWCLKPIFGFISDFGLQKKTIHYSGLLDIFHFLLDITMAC